MHKIRSVDITGFRGQKTPIHISLSEDANFIIGRNGTGKTTLINLLNAVLRVDTSTLRSVKFERVELKLKAKGSARIPRIRVEKRVSEEGVLEVVYSLFEDSRSSPDVFEIQLFRRRPPPPNVTGTGVRRSYPQSIYVKELQSRLESLYQSKWLSLRRGDDDQDLEDTEYQTKDGATDVDRKLEQVLDNLVRYFSRLDRRVAEQTAAFQKGWFLSFLATERSNNLGLAKIDMKGEREAIVAIFEKFGLPRSEYEAQIDKHFKLADKAMASMTKTAAGIQFKDFLIVYDVMRLHTLVEQWEELLEKQREIYQTKTNFIEIASSMLFRKRIEVNSSNQVVVVNSVDGAIIGNRQLSSGEKQLLIFLSETLLQEEKPYIFLADEPELSLHVEWQLELVPNFLRINPQAQVVFATHSPDVVGRFQNRLIKMENLVD